jgi:hypothetical protein
MLSVSSPLVIFCDENSLDILASFRKNKETTLFVIDSIWDVVKYNDFLRNESYEDKYQTKQLGLDFEKGVNILNARAILSSKIFLINFAAELNLYKSNLFIYCEIDAWKRQILRKRQNVNFFRSLINIIQKHTSDEHGYTSIDQKSIEVGFVAGSAAAIRNLYESFDA